MALMNTSITMAAADDLLIRETQQRSIATILRPAGLRNANVLTPPLAEVDSTQEELAHLTNLSRNATGVLLRDLAKRGHITLRYKSMRILNASALQDLVRSGGEDQYTTVSAPDCSKSGRQDETPVISLIPRARANTSSH